MSLAEPFYAALPPALPTGPRPSALLEGMWGAPLAPCLARFVDAVAAVPDFQIDELCVYPTTDWAWADAPFAAMLAEWFRRVALPTGTIPIGCTGGGDVWLLEATAPAPRVFCLDRDEMIAEPIADSIEAFALYLHLSATRGRGGLVPEEAWAPLAGHVRGSRDVAGPPEGVLRLAARADLRQRSIEVDDLLGCLWYGRAPRTQLAAPRDASAHALIEALLHSSICADRERLATWMARLCGGLGVVELVDTPPRQMCGRRKSMTRRCARRWPAMPRISRFHGQEHPTCARGGWYEQRSAIDEVPRAASTAWRRGGRCPHCGAEAGSSTEEHRMTHQLIDKFIETWLVFGLQLREKQGLNEAHFEEQIELLTRIKAGLAGEGNIPKNMAEIFLDIWGAMTSCAALYEGDMVTLAHATVAADGRAFRRP